MTHGPKPYEIAMIQMDCTFLDTKNNIQKATALIREAAEHGAELICLPEAFNTGYLGSNIPAMTKLAEPLDGITISAIQKGMKYIANINVYGFAIFLAFLLVTSNASFLFNLSTEALGGFAGTFVERILVTGESVGSQWPQWWTTFYWFSWMAWGPTSGAFMGRIAYGRTVKQMLGLYVAVCATISGFWMVVVSGTALWVQKSGTADLCAAYAAGTENVPYEMLAALPGGKIVIPLFIVLIFLSTVTACNSNFISMAGISTHGISPDSPEPPKQLTLLWCTIIIAVGYIMIATVGVNGVKIIANFGGMFAVLIMIGTGASLGVLIKKYKNFDKTLTEAERAED